MYSTSQQSAKLLVGNKIDVGAREVSSEEANEFARKQAMMCVPCSARTVHPPSLASSPSRALRPPTPRLWTAARRYIETSAKSRTGIRQAFEELVQKVLETPELLDPDDRRPTAGLAAPDAAAGGCSC